MTETNTKSDAVRHNAIRGCLIGGAVGDALGAPVEFLDRNEILQSYGPDGVTGYVEFGNGTGAITDDTQMTLFTAEGMLRAIVRLNGRGICDPVGVVNSAYLRWLKTQGCEVYSSYKYLDTGWLIREKQLFQRRAPGMTCIHALENNNHDFKARNDSKGCGGVMRVAPVGLYYGRHLDLDHADYIGAEVAALTHGHPLGYIPAAALTHIIALITHHGCSIDEATAAMRSAIARQYHDGKYTDYFLNLIRNAADLAYDRKIGDTEAIRILGEGWVAEEALAIAIFCSLRYSDDFTMAVMTAVNHDGDSDSTGAITGNIVGAYLGLSGIPEKWVRNLELKDIIMEIADDLFHDCQISEYGKEKDPEWKEKYLHNRSIHRTNY